MYGWSGNTVFLVCFAYEAVLRHPYTNWNSTARNVCIVPYDSYVFIFRKQSVFGVSYTVKSSHKTYGHQQTFAYRSQQAVSGGAILSDKQLKKVIWRTAVVIVVASTFYPNLRQLFLMLGGQSCMDKKKFLFWSSQRTVFLFLVNDEFACMACKCEITCTHARVFTLNIIVLFRHQIFDFLFMRTEVYKSARQLSPSGLSS